MICRRRISWKRERDLVAFAIPLLLAVRTTAFAPPLWSSASVSPRTASTLSSPFSNGKRNSLYASWPLRATVEKESTETSSASKSDRRLVEQGEHRERKDAEKRSRKPSGRTVQPIKQSQNPARRVNPTASGGVESTSSSNDQKEKMSDSSRLTKAKMLLEQAQVSPSQRLEMGMENKPASVGNAPPTKPAGSVVNGVSNNSSKNKQSNGFGDEFGNSQMRMADTFDSVDNLVDSQSLLPGGRWVNEPPSTPSIETGPQDVSEMELRRNNFVAGNVAEPLVRYDPVEAEKILFRQPAKWLVRNVQIALPFGLWLGGLVADVAMGRETENRRNRAKQLNSIIASLGPAIIKAGQALASRPDLLPSEYLDELQKLQDDVPTFSNDKAFDIVEKELNRKFEDVFELVEKEPIAAASIGQVYKARIKSNGQTVAIKIQRPNTEDVVALDLYVLRWWSGVYNTGFRLLGRDIDLQSVMDDFGALLYAEIDYVAEAANARRFSELYAQDVAIADVFVPKVYSDYTTRKVLTMEWVDGFRLTDSESLEAYNLDKKKLVDTLVQCSLRQIMENGFFHADPHAGNLLATRDGRLCYLDFGMMSYAATAQRNGFLLAVVHIVNRDWGELVRVYQRLGFIPDGTDVKPIELALENALPDVLNADISELNFKNVVGKLGDIMYTYPFSLPPFYISIIRCLGVLEGLAIQVDPKARIISAAYPYVANRVLTDDSQEELREALRRLVFTADGRIRWERLESLLDEAKESSGFDVLATMEKLVDYIISSEGEELLNDIADQIVQEADSLGQETLRYVTEAFAARDEKAAAKALESLFRSLTSEGIASKGIEDGSAGISIVENLTETIAEALPAPTPAMERTRKIALLLGTQGATSSNADVAKFVPLIRKLGQEPRVARTASEIVARLSERLISRGLRVAFGLPSS